MPLCNHYSKWLYAFGGFLILFKLYIKLTTRMYRGRERLDGKTIIVTGANSGIGYIAAREFARRGARVIMICRDMRRAENAMRRIIRSTGNDNVTLKYIDFSSFTNVRRCACEILAEESRIDVLLNNAGAAGIGFDFSVDGLDVLMQTNYFGPFLFTNILLGRIKQSAPSRIVNVSSMAHWIGDLSLKDLKRPKVCNLHVLYGTTKLASIYFSNELARKLKGTGVTVNSLNPGAFPSQIVRNNNILFQVFWNHILSLFFKTAREAAQTSIYLCVSTRVEKISGEYFEECRLSRASKKARDMNVAKKLWDATEHVVKLRLYEKHY